MRALLGGILFLMVAAGVSGCDDDSGGGDAGPDMAVKIVDMSGVSPDAGTCSNFSTTNESLLNAPTSSVVVSKNPTLPSDPGLP